MAHYKTYNLLKSLKTLKEVSFLKGIRFAALDSMNSIMGIKVYIRLIFRRQIVPIVLGTCTPLLIPSLAGFSASHTVENSEINQVDILNRFSISSSPHSLNTQVEFSNPGHDGSDRPKPLDFEFGRIATDPANLIADEFNVPPELQQRVGFWFDIYTKYGSNHHVIHHVDYPWIIYKVVDTSEIMAGKGARWYRQKKGLTLVSREQRQIVRALKKLASRSQGTKLSDQENSIYKLLEQLPGPRKKVFKSASVNIRSQLGQRDFFVSGLEVSGRYLPHMESVFKNKSIPTELTRLPFVESSFNQNAVSKVGASGIWQIMPTTARGLLVVNRHIDERNCPLKSTIAAAHIFRRNFALLGDWQLAITAYNHGAYGIKKAVRSAETHSLAKLIENYHSKSFGFASQNFFTGFLAALYAEKYKKDIFGILPESLPIEYDYMVLKKTMKVKEISRISQLNRDELSENNPDLKYAIKTNAAIPAGFKVRIPTDREQL